MRTRPDWYYTQSAVIPYRLRDGSLEILLITSRKKKRWIVPKGVLEPHLSAADSAAKEALEEAGIRGRIHPEPLGSYDYEKWGGTCSVQVFVMEVTTILDAWPEDHRERQWLSPEEAARRVEEPELERMLAATARINAQE